jgi:simple sugar transport system substrate-binding protein
MLDNQERDTDHSSQFNLQEEVYTMKRRRNLAIMAVVVAVVVAAVFIVGSGVLFAQKKEEGARDFTFYWISHGSEGDPIWIYAIRGAEQAGKDLGVKVNTSFHHQDLASHKEAFMAAISAGADGIATSSPQQGVFGDEVNLARSKGIPVVFFNTDDKSTGRLAYVGADLFTVGFQWASYLVDNGHVKSGDTVWMPVEVPGASYGVLETQGIASVFDPLGINYEIFDAQYDPVLSISNMTDFLTVNKDKIDAMIGLGDMVTGNVKEVWDAVGIKPGDIPVVGWGNSPQTANSVKEGYVLAATWQYPMSQGYVPMILLYMENTGVPIGYDVPTMALYDKSRADLFIELTK